MLLALLAQLQNTLPAPPVVVLTPIPVTGLVTGTGTIEGWTDGATISFGVIRRGSVYGAFLLDSITIPGSGGPEECPRPPLTPIVACSPRPAPTTIVACPRVPDPPVIPI